MSPRTAIHLPASIRPSPDREGIDTESSIGPRRAISRAKVRRAQPETDTVTGPFASQAPAAEFSFNGTIN